MYKKNLLFIKIILKVLLFFGIFSPLASFLWNKNAFCGGEYVNSPKFTKELKDKLDLLRVHQVLGSVNNFEGLTSLITNNEWEELELEKILDNWSAHTKTKFDLWGLKFLLKYAPAGSKEFLKILVYDDKAFEDLEKIMARVTGAQDFLISYWDDLDKLNSKSKYLYSSLFNKIAPKVNYTLNSNKVSLEVLNSLDYAWPIYNICAALGLESVIIKYCFCKLVKKYSKAEEVVGNRFGAMGPWFMESLNEIINESSLVKFRGFGPELVEYFKSKIRDHSFSPNVYKNGYDYFRFTEIEKFSLADKWIFLDKVLGSLFDKIKILKIDKIRSYLSSVVSLVAVVGFQAFSDYAFLKRIKDSFNEIRFLHCTTAELQKNLVSFADMLRSLWLVNNIAFSINGKNAFKDIPAIENVKKYLNRQDLSKNSKELLNNLFSETFKTKSCLFYSRSTLLYTHKLMNELKQDFLAPFLQNIAVLGGYLTLARIFRAYENKGTKYCFVDIVDSKKPFISMERAWLPLIKEDEVVKNDINLGVNGVAGNAVITGPNGGGKSTFMLTVAFNVLLSKLGIAAAEKALVSDFCAIRTSLRPLQDISSGLSTFMAENKRACIVKDAVKDCSGNILVLLDEPYRGTVEVESAKRVYNIASELAQDNSNCCLLLATHLRKPIELEENIKGLFKNYQMGYLERENGLFERTFKVLDGPALWWFDDDIKRERFIDWLCSTGSCS